MCETTVIKNNLKNDSAIRHHGEENKGIHRSYITIILA